MLVRYQRGISAYLSGLLTALTSLYLIEGNITLFNLKPRSLYPELRRVRV